MLWGQEPPQLTLDFGLDRRHRDLCQARLFQHNSASTAVKHDLACHRAKVWLVAYYQDRRLWLELRQLAVQLCSLALRLELIPFFHAALLDLEHPCHSLSGLARTLERARGNKVKLDI